MLTPKDVSKKLGIGITSTYKLFNLKGFPKIRIGKKYFVDENDLTNFLSEYKGSTIQLE